jgi:hypothetical protein
MNVGVGGNYLGNPSQSAIDSSSTFPREMQVDYVRIHDVTAPLELSAGKTNAGLVLTWPANIVCHLESSTSLTGIWTTLTNAPNPYSLLPARTMFYRLQSP